MKEKIRDLESMPLNTKLIYSKILSLMTFTDDNYDQLKISKLYTIINKIQLPSMERIQLIKFIMRKEITFTEICKEINLDTHLNDQEKNIFRFSLMKDLIIIMKANYIETDEEKRLLKEIQDYFNISNEQLSFFEEEYELDRCFFDETISDNKFKEITKKTVSTATALGIPLTVIYYSGTFKGLGLLGTISGLRDLGMKRKTGKYSLLIGIGTSIALGVITYKTLEYILNVRKDEKTKLAHLMKKNMEALHEATKDTLYKDIEYFTYRMIETKDKNGQYAEDTLKIINILKRTVATLENMEAVII